MDRKTQFKVKRKPVAASVDVTDSCKPLTLGLALQKSLVNPKSSKFQPNQGFHEGFQKHQKINQSPSNQIDGMHIKRAPTPESLNKVGVHGFNTPPSQMFEMPEPFHLTQPEDVSHAGYTDALNNSNSFVSSAGSVISPPPLSSLLQLKVACALCKDKNMLRLNAAELRCGHFVHGSCLRDLTRRNSSPPFCRSCGAVCEQLFSKDAKRTSSVYSSMTPDSLAVDGEHLVSVNCDVEPLMIRAYAHPTGSGSCELLVQVTASKGVIKSHWKHISSPEQRDLVKKLGTDAIGVTQLAGQHISQHEAGSLRLVSNFQLNGRRVVAYLFVRYLVILQHSDDGFEELVGIIDLQNEQTEVYQGETGGLTLHTPAASHTLLAGRLTISTWLAAVNDLSLVFPVSASAKDPLVRLGPPLNPGYVESGTLDFILCMPIERIEKVVPQILGQLGPQDRLGLVVVLVDGASAWLAPHKPSWSGWNEIAQFDVDACRLFTAASKDVLSTAISLFPSRKTTGRQQSVAIVSGCPLASTSIPDGTTVHTIGYGEMFDLELMTRLARASTKGKFYFAESPTEVDSCLVGLVASDRTYVHHDIQLHVELRNGASICGVIGQSNVENDERSASIEIPLGSLMSGQSRTVLFEVFCDSLGAADILGECEIRSKSALTGLAQYRQCFARVGMGQVPDVIFFDRLTRVSAEIVREGMRMAATNNSDAIYAILGQAAAKIEEATKARPLESAPGRNLLQLSNTYETAEIMVMKAKLLAFGLRELQLKIPDIAGTIPLSVLAMLYETANTLETQCAVTSRSGIERVFFEFLDSNRL